jgi:hypothetical protein
MMDKMRFITTARARGILQNCRNEAGMSMKTKGRYGKLPDEAGMYMKIKALRYSMRECC